MIRDAVPADAAAVAAIYAHHVLHGTASFDTEPPSVEATAEKIVWVAERGWAWLVAEEGGAVAGYVYFTQFRDRPAYRWCAEDSIYVRADAQGRGVGRALLG